MLIWTGGRPSEGAKELATALGCKRLKPVGRNIRTDVLVNWGSSEGFPQRVEARRVLNDPLAVQVAANKLAFFEAVGDAARVPQWTTNRDLAVQWRDQGEIVVARTLLRGSGGAGIVIGGEGVDIPRAPLYTKYVRKTHEYRVHICGQAHGDAAAIFVQRKIRRPGHDVVSWQIRNLENGFIYQAEPESSPIDVIDQAKKAFNCTNLDFGAVDVLWSKTTQKATVLEINTAPGLEERTAKRYAEAIKALV